jgi:hypothetical protein
MFHSIEFGNDFLFDVEVPRKNRLERMLIHKGTRFCVQLKPYVVDTADGPIEVADLFFEDGTAARGVRFECFAFVD